MNHVYTCQARRNDVQTQKQNVFSSTFVFAVLVFYKLLELNELWSSISFVVQKSSGHKPTKSFYQWTFFLFSSSDDPQPAQIALPPASTKQEAQAVPQRNGFLSLDCSMMRPEKWNQAKNSSLHIVTFPIVHSVLNCIGIETRLKFQGTYPFW